MLLPEKALLRASQWCYSGVWAFITRYLFVSPEAPRLQGADDSNIQSFRPADGFLRYLKFFFWIGLMVIDLALFAIWIILLLNAPVWVNILLTPIIWAIMIVPDIIAYVALHLRYDSTWYVLSDRSMRIRRGIWQIHETTITYENIQNVTVMQGPLQRYFGISDVKVDTAGGGSAAGHGSSGHQGLLEGVDCAEEIRQLILAKWKQTKSTGLGDPNETSPINGRAAISHFSNEQVELLEEIRDLAVALDSQ